MGALVSWQIHPDVVSRRLGDTVVLVNLADNAIYELNRTGARTLELIASGSVFDQIVTQLSREFEADPATIAGEVERLVSELMASGLIGKAT
jgi:hypothetical protein